MVSLYLIVRMSLLQEIKKETAKTLELDSQLFSYPPDNKMGDISLPCFTLSKKESKNPAEIAKEMAEKANQQENLQKIFSKIEAFGPYLNFFIKAEYLADNLFKEINKNPKFFGKSNADNPENVMIEYSNGNTHKEYHVGHVRNIAYGEAVKNLINSQGNRAIPVSYINDFGIHTAKTVWNWRRNEVYNERPESKGFLLGKCYSEASKILTDKPELKNEVINVMKNIESRSGSDYDFWKLSRKWSIDYFASIYKEIGIKFMHIFYESELIDEGFRIVEELKEKKVLIKSDGAWIADLNEYGLGVLPIIRSDGTALYPVADLALASEKSKRYKLATSIYVIDIRQSLYFKQLSKLIELSGHQEKIMHLSYDFVTLPEGMMASRTGNVVTYEDLKTVLYDRLFKETAERHKDWTNSRIEKVAKSLAVSTMKFEMLKVSPDKTITFNIEESSRPDGFTACYVLYGYARMRSVIRKGGLIQYFSKAESALLQDEKERELLIKMAKFPEIVSMAAEKYNSSDLIKYSFELVQMFNDYYHSCNILKSEKNIRIARLKFLRFLSLVLVNSLSLCGLEPLEEM